MNFIGIKEVVLIFYFAYWVVYNQKPFPIWILIIGYIFAYLFLSFIIGILNKSTKEIKKESENIRDTIKAFEHRLNNIEKFTISNKEEEK